MTHDTSSQALVPNLPRLLEPLHVVFEQLAQDQGNEGRTWTSTRVQPASSWPGLCLGDLRRQCFTTRGLRILCAEGLFGLPIVNVCDQAVYKCLAQHSQAIMQHLGTQFATAMQRVEAQRPVQRGSFASAVIAFDESAVDDLFRWLKPLRPLSQLELIGDRRPTLRLVSVYLYNLPALTNALSAHVLDRLLSTKGFAGIKDSGGDWATFEHLNALRAAHGFDLLVGSDSLYLRALEAGASGIVSGVAAAVPN